VKRIVDGDTLIVTVDRPGPIPAGDHRVRLLEIDSPETVRPNYPVQCGGAGATEFARAELPEGSAVYLVSDREDKDEFGRYLRYLWDFDGEFFNEKAVAGGHARALLIEPNDRYIDRMRSAELSAKQNKKGVWGQVCAAAQ
jgi:micrococcal nuclease